MDEKQLEAIKGQLQTVVDDVMEKRLGDAISPLVAKETRAIVEKLQIERSLFGRDRTGMNEDQKNQFVEVVKAAAGIKTKANESLVGEQDSRGGYLVAKEVESAILRIAASVGLIMGQAQQWPMATDEKGIPSYTGAFLEGEFLGFDAEGDITGINFGEANLIAKKWQLAFVVGNDLLADASVQLADWLLALGGEALANMTDKQGFVGTGAPFIGVLNHPDVTSFTLPTGHSSFDLFDVVVDAANTMANLEESVLDGAAWYMNRTVWAKLRTQKDTAGNFILPQAGAVSAQVLAQIPTGGGLRPAGEIGGFPVYTSRHLPSMTQSAVSTNFIIFGNMKALNVFLANTAWLASIARCRIGVAMLGALLSDLTNWSSPWI